MEKLFSDSEVMLNERLTKITEQQEKEYLEEVAQEIIDNNWSNSPIEKIIKDLSNISWTLNSGYKIAKELEGYSSKARYNIKTDFIEFLDDFNSNKDDIVRENVKDWVQAFNPKPKFKTGQKLIVETPLFRGHNQGKKGDVVYVTGKNEKEANYYIHENKDHNGGYVLAYEKVENNCKIYNDENEN